MKKIIKYIVFVLQICLFTSCTSLFQPQDENIIDEDFVKEHPENAEGLMLTAYSIYNNMHCWLNGNSNYYLSVASDEAVSNKTNGYLRMVTGQMSGSFNPVGSFRWNESYKGVTYVNKFLSISNQVKWNKNPELNTLFERRLNGEALALRASLHHMVLECFAGKDHSGKMLGVPYYDKFLDKSEDFIEYQRLPFETIVKELNDDYEEAFQNLPFIYSDNPGDIPAKDSNYDPKNYLLVNGAKFNHRINGLIVRALQARLMLFAGSKAYEISPELTEYYNEKAVEYASAVLQYANYSLAPDGIEFYNNDNDLNNPEFVWRMSKLFPDSNPEKQNFMPSLNGNGTVNPTQNFVEAFPMKNGYPISHDHSGFDPKNPYSNRDPRLSKFVIYHGSTFKDETVNITPSNAKDGINNIFEKSTRTGYYLKKLLNPSVVIPDSGPVVEQMHIYPLVRFTEIFLILAEAQNNLVGPDQKSGNSQMTSREIIKALRKRAMKLSSDPYLDSITTPEEMASMIQNERRIELSFEGFRFWDMRRWNLSLDETLNGCEATGVSYDTFKVEERPMSDDKYRYLPLLRNDIRKFNYVQNAGW